MYTTHSLSLTPPYLVVRLTQKLGDNIWTKFGLVIDFDLLKAVTSTNTKPEVVFSGRGRHLEKWI